MRTKEWKWALSIFCIILLAYILPYTILSQINKWYGSYLVWIVLTLLVIGIVYFFTKDWGRES